MEQEQHVIWIVQIWEDEPYSYWRSCAEPARALFEIPQVGFADEIDGRQKLAAIRIAYPDGKYRLVKQTTTIEVMG